MHILIADQGKIPAHLYGGTERVIWYLGQELNRLGHHITFLVAAGSSCPFADVVILDPEKHPFEQIPAGTDIAHFNFPVQGECTVPLIFTNHGNRNSMEPFHINTVFVSKNHAERYGSETYIHNGMNWDDYGKPDFNIPKRHFHFLGNAAWRIKNVRGAIDIIKGTPKERLAVLGGQRFNFKMGLRFTFSPRISFYGMVGGEDKYRLLRQSKGMVFPVRWHEPFGLALIESLYFGCPVFGTPYGSLPELITPEVGYLSPHSDDHITAIQDASQFSARHCHEYAADNFNAGHMTHKYLELYQKVLSGETLNHHEPVLKEESPKYLPWD